MTHQFRDKKQIERKKKIIRNLIGFGLFIILFSVGVFSWSGQIFNYIGKPIWGTENFLSKGFHNINYLFYTKKSLLEENRKLIEENYNIKILMVDYQMLKDDVDKLKEILGRVPIKNNLILGNILTKPNHSPYDTILIDIGIDNNIKEGDKVYASGNIPIGSISKVYERTSLVSLYTNPNQKTEGFIKGTNASIELVGRGGGNFEMIIPVELIIENGMAVFLPGNESEVIALVDEIISKPTDPFKKVILSSPVNVQNLKWVEIKKL